MSGKHAAIENALAATSNKSERLRTPIGICIPLKQMNQQQIKNNSCPYWCY
jgi:hypothetical protein